MTDLPKEDRDLIERVTWVMDQCEGGDATVMLLPSMAAEHAKDLAVLLAARSEGPARAPVVDEEALRDALWHAEKALVAIRRNVMVEVIGGNTRFDGVPEILADDIKVVRAAIGASQ